MIREITNYRNLKEELKQFKKIKAFDIETTGLSPEKGEKITEYASVTYDASNDTEISFFQTLIDPGKAIPQFITEITGISDSDVVDAPLFKEIAPRIRYDLEEPDCILMGHNIATFDLPFIQYELKVAGFDFHEDKDLVFLDTVKLSRFLVKEKLFDNKGSNKLEHLALDVFNVPDPGHHRAHNDSIVCYSVFRKLEGVLYDGHL